MRISLWVAAVCGFVIVGCARKPVTPRDQAAAIAGPAPVAAPVAKSNGAASPAAEKVAPGPIEALSGKVSSANASLKFVVLTFPIGQMASINQKLNLYRAGVKVGEVVVTGPQRDENIIADIVAGEAQVGDEAHD